MFGYEKKDIKYDHGINEWNNKQYRVITFNDGKQIWFDEETGEPTWIVDGDVQVFYDMYHISMFGYEKKDIKYDHGINEWNNKQYRVITFNDGKQVWFDIETGKPTGVRDGEVQIFYDYDISAEEKAAVYELYDLDPSVPFDFIATAHIKGHKMKFYSINSQEGTAGEMINNFAHIYNECLNEDLLAILENNFAGVLISPWEVSSYPPYKGKAGAYVGPSKNGKQFYMYVPESNGDDSHLDFSSDYYKYTVPFHEIGHVFEGIFKNENNFDLVSWNSLYERYKEILPELSWSGYSELPNELEFFADSTANYFLAPEELQRYLPEVYNFLNELYG